MYQYKKLPHEEVQIYANPHAASHRMGSLGTGDIPSK